MKKIILTAQSNGSCGWRLGINKEDSIQYFSHLESVQIDLADGQVLICNAACGTSKKKAYDFNNVNLSKWIVDNNFHQYIKRRPTKLVFKLTERTTKKTLIFETVKTSP